MKSMLLPLLTLVMLLGIRPTFADNGVKNMVNFTVEVQHALKNDEIRAHLFDEMQHTQPEVLAKQLNQHLKNAHAIAKKYPEITLASSQFTQPIYDANGRKIRTWQGRAILDISSKDMTSASQFISEVSPFLKVEHLAFGLSKARRDEIETTMIPELMHAFKQRAELIAHTLQKKRYHILNLSLSRTPNSSQFVHSTPMASMAKSAVTEAYSFDFERGESEFALYLHASIQLAD